MLINFFFLLKHAGVPVSVKEFLTLLDALKQNCIASNLSEFHTLARLILVKDEIHYDKFDRAFGSHFQEIETTFEIPRIIPENWLEKQFERYLSEADKTLLKKFGRDELLSRLNSLLQEQTDRHAGGNKWIGTGGTSPFGHGGYNPEGIRIGGQSRHRTAIKVWEDRLFRDYDDQQELNTRNLKMALRKLRRFARLGHDDEFALDDTIRATAQNGGALKICMRPKRKNHVNTLMLLDVGGSMDDHIARTEELFSAARSEFKHLDFFYFHNCVYERLWQHNKRRHTEHCSTWNILHTYPSTTRLIFVGDASMNPYELLSPGGSVEHNNQESGQTWLKRFTQHFKHVVWLNPEFESNWKDTPTIQLIQENMDGRMFPLTIAGLELAIKKLAHGAQHQKANISSNA